MGRAPAMLLICLAASIASIDRAEAARVLRTDFDGLVNGSAMIVEGEVLSVDIDAGQLEPRTRITLRIDRHFDGEHPGSHLVFDLPMGMMADGTVLDIAEAPRFAPGGQYLVFYKRGDWNITPVVGWDQGYFRAVEVEGQSLFVSAAGHCVTGLGPMGFELGRRVTGPASMPGFGDPVVVSHVPHGPPSASCLPASTVRSLLQSRLASAPVPPTPAWRTTPARSILEHRLAPDVARMKAPRPAEALGCGEWASCPAPGQP